MIFDWFRKKQQEAPSLKNQEGENKSIESEPPKLSSDQLLIRSIEKFRNQMLNVASKSEKEHEESIAEASKRIKYADNFIKKTGLNNSLLTMLQEMWHWPSWMKRDGFDEYKKIDLTDLSGEEIKSKNKKTKRICFVYGGEKYRFEFDEGGYYDQWKFGAIRFYQNENLVLSIKVSQDLDGNNEYDEWDYMSIDALKTGPWVGHVVEIEEKIRLSKDKLSKDLESKRIMEQTENLPKNE